MFFSPQVESNVLQLRVDRFAVKLRASVVKSGVTLIRWSVTLP